MNKDSLSGSETTVSLKSKLPVASRFLRDENRVARDYHRALRESCRIIEEAIFGTNY